MSNSDLLAFKAISEFVAAIGDAFGPRQKSLALYARLIDKTTLSHKDVIKKHVNKFRTFCVVNRKAIQEKKGNSFIQKSISYSDRVYINMEHVFKMADITEKTVIWKHLLTLSALLDKESNAKQILKEGGNEGNFIEQAFDEIKNTMEGQDVDASNPMGVAMSLLGSGAFQNLLSGITTGVDDGSLDVGNLMGTVQKMLTGLQDDVKGEAKSKVETKQIESKVAEVENAVEVEENEVVQKTIEELEMELDSMEI